MADSSSGRNKINAGSDSAPHHGKGGAYEQHQAAPKASSSMPVTGRQSHGYVGDGEPGKADPRSTVK